MPASNGQSVVNELCSDNFIKILGDMELLLFVFVLITKASLEKRLVEKIIDEYFTN